MPDELEKSVLNDLWGSGCLDEDNAPNPQGLTVDEIAAGVKESKDEVRDLLEMLSSFTVVPLEECGKKAGPKRYRLTGSSEFRNYRDKEFPNSGWWAPED